MPVVGHYLANRNQPGDSKCTKCEEQEMKMQLLCWMSYLRSIYVAQGGEPERMPHVNSSNLECLERLVLMRERTVKEYVMNSADLLDTKYHNCSIELLVQTAKAKRTM